MITYQDETIIKIKNYGTPISSLYFFIIESFLLGYLHFWKRLRIDNDLYCCLFLKLEDNTLIRSFIPQDINSIEEFLMTVNWDEITQVTGLNIGDKLLLVRNNQLKLVTIGGVETVPPLPPLPSEEDMRIFRENAWYMNLPGEIWNWYDYPQNYLSISPFIIDSGYKLKSIGILSQDTDSSTNNLKFCLWEDVNGRPDFSKQITNGEVANVREGNYNWKLLSINLQLSIDKRLVWIGVKSQIPMNCKVMSNNGGDFDVMGFVFPGNTTEFSTWKYTSTGYAVENCDFNESWQSTYSSMVEVNGSNNLSNNLLILGQLEKV